ncbi:MAG: hypothetical protein JO037_12080 [Actinobacteria bacterium]|nr:hypothetical protein [Actinomycetota bacterium]
MQLGTFEVQGDDKVVGQVGPGTVVGERGSWKAAAAPPPCALTEGRVARSSPEPSASSSSAN